MGLQRWKKFRSKDEGYQNAFFASCLLVPGALVAGICGSYPFVIWALSDWFVFHVSCLVLIHGLLGFICQKDN